MRPIERDFRIAITIILAAVAIGAFFYNRTTAVAQTQCSASTDCADCYDNPSGSVSCNCTADGTNICSCSCNASGCGVLCVKVTCSGNVIYDPKECEQRRPGPLP